MPTRQAEPEPLILKQRALSKARLEHGKLSLSPETTKAPASPASETQKLQAHTRWRYSKWSRSQGEFCTGAIMGQVSGTFLRGLWTECSSAFLPAPGLLGLTAASFIFAGPKDCPSVKARPRRAATWPVSQYPPEPRTVPGTRQMHLSFPRLFPPTVSTEGTTSSTSGIHSIGTERTEGKAELCHRQLGTPSPSGLQPARHTTGHTEQRAHSCPCPRRPRWSACFRSRGPCASPP
uniref:Uncharacterized protein n=1 Tax=Rousettus aegyptiacus TaxID=9407 RepID=A0A7J8E843_ROUAE|nr:hypothetical protein HJG63_008089 [Rousettus aegyptiacus]